LVSACRDLQVEGTKGKGRGRKDKTWNEYVKVDIKKLGLGKDDAHLPDKWRSLTIANRPILPQWGNECVILMECVLLTLNVNDE